MKCYEIVLKTPDLSCAADSQGHRHKKRITHAGGWEGHGLKLQSVLKISVSTVIVLC